MAHHERRLHGTDQIDQFEFFIPAHLKGIVPQIKAFQPGNAQSVGSRFGLGPADRFDLVERFALFPEPRAFPAFSE